MGTESGRTGTATDLMLSGTLTERIHVAYLHEYGVRSIPYLIGKKRRGINGMMSLQHQPMLTFYHDKESLFQCEAHAICTLRPQAASILKNCGGRCATFQPK